ncbi:U-box domain protein [Legionella gratiana]|uniref:U-box domain protein n=1 Tax=Legionella gratiana TaxID=45066 RepID=A0A378JEF6_9GAMM|nr:U-box domain-containing protein [Legionella gratiana]KTD06550.1 U-box domain protein [Legionella gratiana]STX45371.1 Ubiquitin fusion degradation protein 2 [Legionella gratiana]
MYQSSKNQVQIDEIIGKPDSKTKKFKKKIAQIERLPDLVIPEDYKCPLSKCLMIEPIQLDDGHFYDRSSIIMYLENNPRAVCPLNRNYKVELRFYPTNVFMKNEIENYVNQQLQTLSESVSPRLN